jgi:hypothetical protein
VGGEVVKEQRGKTMQVKISVPPNLEATYSNFAVITHTASEIIIDFATVLPNTPKSRVLARIVTTPMHAKMIQKALSDNVELYESQYGEIKIPANGDALARQLFGGARPPSDSPET